MAVPFERQVSNPGQVITAAQVDHLPIIAQYARRLGLVEMINGLVPVEIVSGGVIVYQNRRFKNVRAKKGRRSRKRATA